MVQEGMFVRDYQEIGGYPIAIAYNKLITSL